MSTATLPHPQTVSGTDYDITMPEALKLLSREERFMATVAAMNTLLVQKGVYSQREFDRVFCDWAIAQQSRPKSQRPGWRSSIFSRLLGR